MRRRLLACWAAGTVAFAILSFAAAQQASLVMGLLWITGVALLVALLAVITWGVVCGQQASTPPPRDRHTACCSYPRWNRDAADALHAGKLAQVDARLAGEAEEFPRLLSPEERLARRTS